jgi:hypothetical protein
MTFIEKIEQLGWTRKQFREIMNIHPTTMVRWKKGFRPLSVDLYLDACLRIQTLERDLFDCQNAVKYIKGIDVKEVKK